MNYLGHLFLSNNDTKLMLTNLYGDFVKGKDLGSLSPGIQHGVKLHRAIDYFIDTHPLVVELLHELYPQLPKVSGIAVDLYFDHLLARDWQKYHSVPLESFLSRFYASIDLSSEDFSESFRKMIKNMISYNWMSAYPTLDGLNKACHGVSSRISFPNELSRGLQVFLDNESTISAAFEGYIADARDYFRSFNSK